MEELWIHRILVILLTFSWIASWRSGLVVFRQKLTPEYQPLPGLIKSHVSQGVAWAVLLAVMGGACLVRSRGVVPALDLSVMSAIVLVVVSSAVAYTGYGLKIGKPTGVWVHVFLVMIATGLALAFLSKYLWNCLS